MINYSTITTNHRICVRLINFYKTLGTTYEFTIEQDGEVLDNGKIVDGFSITFYRLKNEDLTKIKNLAKKLIKAKNATEKNLRVINGKIL